MAMDAEASGTRGTSGAQFGAPKVPFGAMGDDDIDDDEIVEKMPGGGAWAAEEELVIAGPGEMGGRSSALVAGTDDCVTTGES